MISVSLSDKVGFVSYEAISFFLGRHYPKYGKYISKNENGLSPTKSRSTMSCN